MLARDTVRHVGDAIAFVVAETVATARDALEAIEVEYEVLPAVVDARQAILDGAPAVWSEAPLNVAFDTNLGDKAAVDEAFAKANQAVSIAVENNRLITNFIETRGVVASFDGAAEIFTLTISSQGVHSLRDTLAKEVLKVSPDKVRVITPDVGGGFGTKAFMYREYALAAEAARRPNRPVKWIADRMDHFTGDSQGREPTRRARLALARP